MSKIKNELRLGCALALIANVNCAVADLAADAETVLNWGEKTYPQALSTAETTQIADIWFYRFYPKSNLYVGINSQDNGVYTLYGSPGAKPEFIDNIANLLPPKAPTDAPVATPSPIAVAPTPPPASNDGPQCDTANAPSGIAYNQVGNNLTITTNGQCITFPVQDICLPKLPFSGGESVLKTMDIQSYTLSGINFVNPAMAKLFEPQIKTYGNIKTCVKNAPLDFSNLNISVEGCFDVTDRVKDFPSISGLVKVSPPVSMQILGNISSATIADCFSTDATIITDALTHEVWDKKGGTFVKR